MSDTIAAQTARQFPPKPDIKDRTNPNRWDQLGAWRQDLQAIIDANGGKSWELGGYCFPDGSILRWEDPDQTLTTHDRAWALERQAERAQEPIKLEIHYKRPWPDHPGEVLHTYATAIMTTDSPASSYGQPVLVVESSMRHGDPVHKGMTLGPGDIPDDAEILVDEHDYNEAKRRFGREPWAPHLGRLRESVQLPQ